MRTDFQSDAALRDSVVLSNSQVQLARLATLGREALIAEAELTPKPGLVDSRGAGVSHRPVACDDEGLCLRD